MNDTPTDSSAHDDSLLERRVRTRYEHACGQIIWVIAVPQGPLYFAELRPTLPPPITVCPRCGGPVTPESLSQRSRRPSRADGA